MFGSDDMRSGPAEVLFNEMVFYDKIGEGAYGTVFRGTCRGCDVAIKQMKDFDVEDAEDVEALERLRALKMDCVRDEVMMLQYGFYCGVMVGS